MKESIKEAVKEYLYFTKSERIGAITLVILFIAVVYSYFTYANQPPAADPMLLLQQEMAQLKLELKQQQQTSYQQPSSKPYPTSNKKQSNSYPNSKKRTYKNNYRKTSNQQLGTNNQQTSNQSSDQKTPKARSSQATNSPKTVAQRTVVSKTVSAPADFTKTRNTANRKPIKRFRKPLKVDINKATAESFQRLYGIGPAYSKRIVKFREALGGFSNLHQISEVYGIPDSTFQSILPNLEISPAVLHKIDLNTATKDELSIHPYLHWKEAKIIIAYREMHGAFQQLDDLKKIHGLEPETLQKMKPYLKFGKEKLVDQNTPLDSKI